MNLVCPILAPGRYQDMLASVDHPVDIILIDNGGVVLDRPAIHPGRNLGVAASWNLGLKVSDGPWCIVNDDVVFGEGDLAAMEAALAETPDSIPHLARWAAFGLTRSVVDRLGFFDENYHPAYCEDTDYARRASLCGVPFVEIGGSTRHAGSSTIHHRREWLEANARTHAENTNYYERKWGGWQGSETFDTPFGRGGWIGEWSLDYSRLARLRWD
jgi:GT2 family glycosyltransferase